MYWGLMETFHWDLATQRANGFRFKFGDMALPCVIETKGSGPRVGRR